MKRLVMELGLLAAVLFFSICAYGAIGDTIWTRFYGGYDKDVPVTVLQTPDNGFMIAGWTYSFGMGDVEYYLIRTDSNGDTLWTRTYGTLNNDVATSAALTRDGGIIVAGTTPINDLGTDIYLMKIDWQGNLEWQRTYGGAREDSVRCIATTRDKGYILCGSTNSFGGSGFDVYVIKLDSVGDTVWTHRSGGIANDGGAAICQTVDDNYLLTGWTTSDDNHNIYTEKISQTGSTIWYWGYSAGIDCQGLSIVSTRDNNAVISGYAYNIPQYNDCYVAKIGNFGQPQWSRTFGGSHQEFGNSIRKGHNNGYVIGGSRWVSFFPDTTQFYLAVTDSMGNRIWDRTYGFGALDEGAWAEPTSDGNYVIVGRTNCFDPLTYDICLIKVCGTVTGVDENPAVFPDNDNLGGNYPNPFNSQTTIRYRVESPGYVKVEMFNLLGQKIRTLVDSYQETGSYKVNWDASGNQSGVYYCRVEVGKVMQTLKVTLVK
jgi:hypothetical protein